MALLTARFPRFTSTIGSLFALRWCTVYNLSSPDWRGGLVYAYHSSSMFFCYLQSGPFSLLIQSFGWAVRQSAEVENNMNGVERIVYYAREVEQEAPHDSPSGEASVPSPWPSTGDIEISNAVVRYRPELPPVLNGLNLNIRGGEHIGIVGRTGAGKSTGTPIVVHQISHSDI